MKKILKKILLISLLFSATIPSGAQAGFFNWTALRSGATEIGNKAVNWLATNGNAALNLFQKNPVAVTLATGVFILQIAYLWKKSKKIINYFLWKGISNQNKFLERTALYLGADIDEQDHQLGFTPLTCAVMTNDSKLVKLLLQNNAEIDKQENSRGGFTPLMRAAWHGRLEIAKLLLQNNATVDQQGKRGLTALMMATRGEKDAENKGDVVQQEKINDIIELLLENGADPLVKAEDGTTVLDQKNNTVIKKVVQKMQKKIFLILNDKKVTPLTEDPAQLTAEFTYSVPC